MRGISIRSALLGIGLMALCASSRAQGPEHTCSQTFTTKEKQSLTDYIRERYKLADNIALTLKDAAPVSDSCFQKLTFQGKSALKVWELTLYASPDGRFLSSDLFDTSVDPIVERRIKNEEALKGLLQEPNATRGPKDAPVTVVEFSDFECPYCKNFARILDETVSSGPGEIRVVFHHMPLSMHPWARIAAEEAGCAELQSSDAFWSLHNAIFQNQGTITPDNAKDKLFELAKGSRGVDAAALRKCMDAGMSVGLVLKDMDLAESYHVNGTPTTFINGQLIQNVDSVAKLRELIATARKESRVPAASAGSVHTSE